MDREAVREAALSNKWNFERYVNRADKKKLQVFVLACYKKIEGKQEGQKGE